MQGNIEQALLLVTAGNAYLSGRDIAGFWPKARSFAWTKACEFRVASESGEGEFPLRAADPIAWFACLKPWCRGLRLHHMERPVRENQSIEMSARMSVAFVGGGPRWVVEAVGKSTAEMWEGFDRLGDRNAPDHKIWLTTYVLLGETRPDAMDTIGLAPALAKLRDVLPRIEAFAREQGYDNFADCFARALTVLDGASPASEHPDDLVRYAGMTLTQQRVRLAIDNAWVFGGMGSWNDIGDTGPEYDQLSEELFAALNETICGLANSTFR
jgi:hypothetical protein